MSNLVYPTLPGLTFEVVRSIIPPPVGIFSTPSRREYRARDATITLYDYTLKYEFLRSAAAYAELQTLVGFFGLMGAQYDSFLFLDPDDYIVSGETFGVGDGTTTAWQLVRSFGGFGEPIFDAVPGTVYARIVDYEGSTPLWSAPRTNVIKRSADLSSVWVNLDSTETVDTTTAPDGTVTADTVTEDTTNAGHGMRQNIAADPTVPLTVSVFAKAGTRTILKILCQNTSFSNKVSVNFDLSAGTVLSHNAAANSTFINATIEPAANGFYRCSLTCTCDITTATNMLVDLYMMTSDSTAAAYLGDGSSTIILWGAQAELAQSNPQGGYEPGRYIATGAAAASATDCSFSSGVITMNFVPVAGAGLTWSGQFYRRCRFNDPQLDATKFMYQLWSAGKVDLRSVLA